MGLECLDRFDLRHELLETGFNSLLQRDRGRRATVAGAAEPKREPALVLVEIDHFDRTAV